MEKEIIGHPGYYVSDSGVVISRVRKVERILRHNKRMYSSVGLSGGKKMYVHRLVAMAYIENPNNLPQVNHKDGNRFNNDVSNLEWCDQKHNMRHAVDTGLNKIGDRLAKSYKLLSPEGEVLQINNMRKFCRDNDLSHGSMSSVVSGVMKVHKGWRLSNS